MYPFAADGSQPNNDEFSPQSRGMMDTVIARQGQGAGVCMYVCDLVWVCVCGVCVSAYVCLLCVCMCECMHVCV